MKKTDYLKSVFYGVMACLFLAGLTTSCEKEEEEDTGVYRYWESQGSYVQCDLPGISFQLNKVARTEDNELEIEYTLVNTGYDHNVSVTFYTVGTGDAVRDDTGRVYHAKSRYNGEYVVMIDGTAFGVYGEGHSVLFAPSRPVLGTVLVKDLSQNATSVWISINTDSNDLGTSGKLEFVNVPIEDGRTSY